MFAPGEQIRELLRTECDEYLICAPFIKVGPLKALLSCIPYGEEALVAVYTRWFAAEVAAGVTDLEVFDLCLERPGTILYLVNSLHAKLYRAGEQCLVPKAKRRVITRHGKPQAIILGIDEWNRLRHVPSFGRLLCSSPLEDGDLPPRDTSASRETEL